jgi:hypothetical protein
VLLCMIFMLGLVEVFVRYRAKTQVSKLASTLYSGINGLYLFASLLLVYVFLIQFFSFINGLEPTPGCVEADETCIFIHPYDSKQANNIFGNHAVSFRSHSESLVQSVLKWADGNGWHAEQTDSNSVHISIVTYWTFLNDINVRVVPCEENEGFCSVIVHAQLRIGTKDFGNDLEARVRSLYAYLESIHKPADYIYTFCGH